MDKTNRLLVIGVVAGISLSVYNHYRMTRVVNLASYLTDVCLDFLEEQKQRNIDEAFVSIIEYNFED